MNVGASYREKKVSTISSEFHVTDVLVITVIHFYSLDKMLEI